ncbi:MAG: hypothetical protein ACRDPS_10305 [Nocardioides sp.]|uniref:hypothetical protein n=1 Tax=Nocardioides sp. TaxID=35761 RepID=UPI003D6C1BB5
MTSPHTSLKREVATLAPAVVFLLLVLQIATGHGAGHVELALAGLVVLATQVVPGALVWRLVRPVRGWLVEDLVMGLGIGAAIAIPFHLLTVAIGVRWLDLLLPVGLAAVLLSVPATRARIRSRELEPLPWAWGVATALSSAGPLLAVLSMFAQPLRWRGWATLYVDVPFQQALAGELMTRVPPHYPQVALEPLTYHWFAHAWTAQVATISDTAIDVLLWRFNPALLMIVAPLVIAIAAMRISGHVWAGPAAALMAYLLPDVIPWARGGMATPLTTPMSPTQQFATMMAGVLLVLIAIRWRGEASRWALPLLVLLLVITGGSKGSTLPVLLMGGLLACAAMLLLRSRARLWVVGLDTLLTGLVLVLLSVFMFGGGSGGGSLDFGHDFVAGRGAAIVGQPFEPASPFGVVVGALCVLVYLSAPAAAFGLLAIRETRRDPLTWLLFGAGAAGIGGLVALTQPGLSQIYFYRAAEPFIAVAAVWGVVVLLGRTRLRRKVLLGGVATGVVALPVTMLVFDRDAAPGVGGAVLAAIVLLILVVIGAFLTARFTSTRATGLVAAGAVALLAAGAVPAAQGLLAWVPPASGVTPDSKPGALHSGDVDALHWLRDHSDADDRVITNNHCWRGQADPCDRRRFFVAAYAERQVLIEGWTYNRRASKLYADYGSSHFKDSQFWDQELLALNDGFIEDPSAKSAQELWELGVRWVVVWDGAPHAETLEPYAERVHEGTTTTVYRMVEPQ